MAYKELKGNIFNSKAQVLVNTVNCVGVMGKGIALEFRRRYPKMFEEYRAVCERRELRPGQILPYRKEEPWVLNLAIKSDWKFPSKIEWIESCLRKFINSYEKMEITSIAFPWMGAMNGGIPIELVKTTTREYLKGLPNIDIEVYDFDPSASDPLYDKLKKIALDKNININMLTQMSGIKQRYFEQIIDAVQTKRIGSLSELINARIIGDTNIERLYPFLIKVDLDKIKEVTNSLFIEGD